mgnify:FL=1
MITSKTFWAGVAGIITAVGGYLTGELQLAASLQLVFTSLIGIFLRMGIARP